MVAVDRAIISRRDNLMEFYGWTVFVSGTKILGRGFMDENRIFHNLGASISWQFCNVKLEFKNYRYNLEKEFQSLQERAHHHL